MTVAQDLQAFGQFNIDQAVAGIAVGVQEAPSHRADEPVYGSFRGDE